MVQAKYYMVVGKDKHIPKTYYTKAMSMAEAKQHFYIEAGDIVSYVVTIRKEIYENNTKNF